MGKGFLKMHSTIEMRRKVSEVCLNEMRCAIIWTKNYAVFGWINKIRFKVVQVKALSLDKLKSAKYKKFFPLCFLLF